MSAIWHRTCVILGRYIRNCNLEKEMLWNRTSINVNWPKSPTDIRQKLDYLSFDIISVIWYWSHSALCISRSSILWPFCVDHCFVFILLGGKKYARCGARTHDPGMTRALVVSLVRVPCSTDWANRADTHTKYTEYARGIQKFINQFITDTGRKWITLPVSRILVRDIWHPSLWK